MRTTAARSPPGWWGPRCRRPRPPRHRPRATRNGTSEPMKSALPIVLDLDGRLVVAVGGGPVSARRVRAFVDEGAVVRLVSPWVCEDLSELAGHGKLEWLARDYAGPADLEGAWLVHTATGEPGVDRQVAQDAAELRIWCVDATDAATTSASISARTDVSTPDGRVTIAT